MKINKISIAILTVIMFSLVSCKDNTLNDVIGTDPIGASINATGAKKSGEGVLVSSLPQALKDYVASKYAGKSIVSAEKYPKGYEVKLSDGTKLEFSLTGAFIEVSGSASTTTNTQIAIPIAITNYISANYPTLTIVKSEQGDKKFEIKLSNGVKLEFNLDGSFREVSGNMVNVSASTLPDAIKKYLATNYASLTVIKVETCNKKIEVRLSDGVKLEFNLDGTFREISGKMCGISNDMDPATLPTAIKTYVSTNYPKETIAKAEKGANKYEVTLSNGVKLEFNLDGSFGEVSGKKKG